MDAVIALAQQTGHLSSRLALTGIRSRVDARQFAAARRVLEDARAQGVADSTCYASLVAACHKAGRHREAKRVFTSATLDPRLTNDDLRRVKVAHRRRRSNGAACPGEAPMAA